MPGFEPGSSAVGRDYSAKCATTTIPEIVYFTCQLDSELRPSFAWSWPSSARRQTRGSCTWPPRRGPPSSDRDIRHSRPARRPSPCSRPWTTKKKV